VDGAVVGRGLGWGCEEVGLEGCGGGRGEGVVGC
jgi:hypothetical protein